MDDNVTQGTLHISELVSDPKLIKTKYAVKQNKNSTGYVISTTDLYNFGHLRAWNEPIIETDLNYVGDFQVQKNMKIEMKKSTAMWATDWLPCCSGGFSDVTNSDTEHVSQKGIFDCTCRNTSISTMKPAWNTTMAQFPTAKFQYKT
jgi:hypothetical protein